MTENHEHLLERRMSEPERESRLERMEGKIDDIAKAVATIAVQNQRLITLERETGLLFTKMDDVKAKLGKVENFQASCPRHSYRGQINTLWVFVSAIIVAIIVGFVRG